MNETLKVLESRRSCRKFKPDMVEKEKLEAIIKAGTYAASGMGKQSPIIVAVTDKNLLAELSEENRRIGGWQEGFVRRGTPRRTISIPYYIHSL